jgi:hypothetical protein
MLLLLGCGGATTPSRLTPEEAKLAMSDGVTPHMCELMIDRVLDLVQEAIPQDAYGSPTGGKDSIAVRNRIEKDRARLKQPDEIAGCVHKYDRSNYECVMRSDSRQIKDCMPGMVWVGAP